MFTIYHEDIHFVDNYWYYLICDPGEPGCTPTGHKYFSLRDYLFGIVLATNQKIYMSLNIIPQNVHFLVINESSNILSNKSSNKCDIISPHHGLNIEIHKTVNDYSYRYIDNFKWIVFNPSPRLTDKEEHTIALFSDNPLNIKILKLNQ